MNQNKSEENEAIFFCVIALVVAAALGGWLGYARGWGDGNYYAVQQQSLQDVTPGNNDLWVNTNSVDDQTAAVDDTNWQSVNDRLNTLDGGISKNWTCPSEKMIVTYPPSGEGWGSGTMTEMNAPESDIQQYKKYAASNGGSVEVDTTYQTVQTIGGETTAQEGYTGCTYVGLTPTSTNFFTDYPQNQ